MSAYPQTNKLQRLSVMMMIALILVAFNLRPIMAAVSPLLDSIQVATGLSNIAAGLLTTLPVFMMGLFALGGAIIQRYLSESRGIFLGVLLIAFACLSRYWFGSGIALIISAVIGGLGIALAQVLIPTFIKTYAPQRAGSLMGFYTTAIMAGAAISAGVSSPVASHIGWQHALALAGIPALLAAVIWHTTTHALPKIVHEFKATLPLNSKRAWLLMLFFGVGTGAYTLVLAWFPPYFTQLGWSASQSGFLLSALTVCEVIAGLLVSSLIHRFPDRRRVMLGVLSCLMVGLLALIYAPNQLTIVVVIAIGFGIGALFPLMLIVAMDHVKHASQAGALLGFVQGGGYMIASLAPLFAGFIREQANSLTQAWQFMMMGVVILMLLSIRLKPNSTL